MRIKGFRKTLAVSLLGHLTIFSVFSLSFGPRLGSAESYAKVYFLGKLLEPADLFTGCIFSLPKTKRISADRRVMYLPGGEKEEQRYLAPYYVKPLASSVASRGKLPVEPGVMVSVPTYKTPAQSITLYPQLPYYFQLYFKDRQKAHIELLFNVMNDGSRDMLLVKRKVSSGNLEADLLSMRYISHYLWLQHSAFTKNSWQSIKIDLSEK